MSDSKLQYYCWRFPLRHRSVAADCVVCMCCVQWWVLEWLPPMSFLVFGYPTIQFSKAKQWSNQSIS